MSALEAALAAGRLAARELQRETVRLYRPSTPEFDWATGTDAPASSLVLYTGLARVKPERAEGREDEAGERNLTLRRYTVSLPWNATLPERPAVGDRIDVSASPDGRMVGLRLWVTDVAFSSTATAWRITAEDRS